MQNLKEKLLVAWKMTQGICLIFMRAVESLKIGTLIGCFCPKHIKIQVKTYRRAMFYDNEQWCKVWSKTDSLVSKNDMKNLVNFHPTAQKSKIFTSMGYFCPKYMRFELKKIQRSYLSWHWTVMQNLNKPWPYGFKNGMRNWVNFH